MAHLLQFSCNGQSKFVYNANTTDASIQQYFCITITNHLLALADNTGSCSKSGSVRLYSYSSSTPENEGTVQYCYSGTWYSVCDYSWDCADANVVCGQLGFGKARECSICTP